MKPKPRAFPLVWFAAVTVAALGAALASAPAARGQTFLYWDLNSITAGAGGVGGNAPSGTWSDANLAWNPSADGTGAPFFWINNAVAVFSAGTNATGTYTVSLDPGATLSASGLIFQEGTVTLGGSGTLSFNQPLPGIAPYINLAGQPLTVGSGVTLSSLFGLSFGGNGGTVTLAGQTNVLGTTTLADVTLQLAAADRLSDASPVQVNAGATLNLGGFNETVGGLAGAGAVQIGAATFTVGSVADTTFSGTVTGTGGVIKSGSATLTLATPAGWTGGTTISGGTLALGASNIFADTAALTVGGAGTLAFGLNSDRIGSLTGTGSVVLGNGTLELGTAASFSFNGVITGLGSFTKRGAGVFTLGGANSFLGTATVAEGTLRLGADERLADTLDLAVSPGATFDLAGRNETIDALTGTGTVTLGGGRLGVGASHAFFTLGAALTGPGDFDKWGNGIVTLTGTFGPSGTFGVQQGSVVLGAADRLADATTVFVAPGATFSLGGFNETVAGLSGLGTVGLGSGRLTVNTAGEPIFGGAITGGGGLTKTGAGTLGLLGASTYSGLTQVNQGKLRLYGPQRLAYGADVAVAAGTAIDFAPTNEQLGQLFGAVTGAGDLTREDTGYASDRTVGFGVNDTSFTFAGRLRGFVRYQKFGVGTLTLTGASDYTGSLDILGGTVRAGADHSFSESDFAEHTLAVGTTLDLAGRTQTLHELFGLGTVDLGVGGTLTLDTYSASRTYDFPGTLTGFGSLTKTGAQRYTLRGPLTYSGPTHVTAGRLQFARTGIVDTDVAVDAGAFFELENVDVTIDQLTGAGGVDLGTGQLVVGSGGGNFSFGGALVGGAGSRWVKNGPGTLTLAGTAAPANLLINAGALVLGGDERVGDTTAVQVVAGATFDATDRTETIGALTGNGAVPLGAGALTVGQGGASFAFGGEVTGSGAFAKTGGGTFTLDGVLLPTGGVAVAAGSLRLGADERIVDGTNLVLGGGASLDLDGHDETLAAVTGTGQIKLPAASELMLGAGNASSVLAAGLNGDGTLTKLGSGDLTFTGKSDGELTVNVAAGRVLVGADDRFGDKTDVIVEAGAQFHVGGFRQEIDLLSGAGAARVIGLGRLLVHRGTFTGALFDTGTVEKTGPGAFTLETPQNFAGTLRVADGVVTLAAPGAWVHGRTTVDAQGTLGLVQTATLHGPLENAGAVTGDVTTLTGAVSGAGTFGGTGFTLTGSYAPGATAGATTVGTFHGYVVLGATHTLQLDLKGTARGTQYDALDVDGPLTLGGTLRLTLGGGYVPAAGHTFDLFSAVSRSGQFSAYDLPALPRGLAWDTSRLRTTGLLSVVSGYAAFVAAAGLDPLTDGAPLANPSGDGVANLLKYLLGGDPRVAQSDLLPVATTDVGANGTVLVLAYDRDALAAATLSAVGVDYTTDFATWTTVVHAVGGATISVTPVDAIFEHVEVRIPIAGHKGFARLRASL